MTQNKKFVSAFKEGGREDPRNNRPISLSSVFSKILKTNAEAAKDLSRQKQISYKYQYESTAKQSMEHACNWLFQFI